MALDSGSYKEIFPSMRLGNDAKEDQIEGGAPFSKDEKYLIKPVYLCSALSLLDLSR